MQWLQHSVTNTVTTYLKGIPFVCDYLFPDFQPLWGLPPEIVEKEILLNLHIKDLAGTSNIANFS